MKVTKRQLRRIIREEKQRVLESQDQYSQRIRELLGSSDPDVRAQGRELGKSLGFKKSELKALTVSAAKDALIAAGVVDKYLRLQPPLKRGKGPLSGLERKRRWERAAVALHQLGFQRNNHHMEWERDKVRVYMGGDRIEIG